MIFDFKYKSPIFASKYSETKRGDTKSPLLFLKKMELKEHIAQLAQNHLPDDSYFLVDVVIKGTDTRRKVLVLIDGDNGVDIDACASVSRALGGELETDELLNEAFTLEVSSPGIDHPISMVRQYKGRVGKRLKLTLKTGDEVTGKLESATDDGITFLKEIKKGKKTETEETNLKYNEIEKSFVLISFK